MKRLSTVLLVLALLLTLIPLSVMAEENVVVIVHYHREDGNYEGWNLWMWADGGAGKQISFTDEDSYGKIAVASFPANTAKVGFIVRLNDWEQKDIGIDRFVELTNGKSELWIESDVEEFSTEAPRGHTAYDYEAALLEQSSSQTEGAYRINVHYRRYDGNYEGWNLWLWKEGGEGASYVINDYDDYGAVISLGLADISDVDRCGIIMRLNEWEQKDIAEDRYFELDRFTDDTLDIWLLQGDSTIHYSQNEVNLTPKFLSAAFEDGESISFSLSVPLDAAESNEPSGFSVTADDGTFLEILYLMPDTEKPGSYIVKLSKPVDMEKNYRISREGYGDMAVSPNALFDSAEYAEAFSYSGDDLGATWSAESTSFKVWAPTASIVELVLYEEGEGGEPARIIPMEKGEKGVWQLVTSGDLDGTYYNYYVTVGGQTRETVDIYAKAVGVNGNRGMVINLSRTDPSKWDEDTRPKLESPNEAMIYELHVRDFSTDPAGNMEHRGKYLAFTESGTTTRDGMKTGVDYLSELGITHVHLLPVFDYSSVDETKLDDEQFNWGYDPKNYNVPEGSYSTNPYDGAVRIGEFKQMVQSLHDNNIGVIMDVVYNHTSASADSWFSFTVPDYYYRMADGAFSNASGCGNETASERSMMRKYIVDSVVYWATEYHVDGFRFDLMGIHDIETMKAVRAALDKIDPSIIIYGEGWTAAASTLPEQQRAMKANTMLLGGIAAFSDELRDGIKGSVFDSKDKGFVSGKPNMEESVKFGIVGGIYHPQLDYSLVNYSSIYWAKNPTQCVNYASAHDNLTLWDKLTSSNSEDSEETRKKMNLLSAAIVYTSQGIAFMQAGEEQLRTKPLVSGQGFDSNSYKSSDYTNALRWNRAAQNADVHDYYAGLIAFRKAHPALRMRSGSEVAENLVFIEGLPANVIAYTIENSPNEEVAEALCVVFNANAEAVELTLPEGEWEVFVDGDQAGTEVLRKVSGSVSVEGISALVLAKGMDRQLKVSGEEIEAKPMPREELSPWAIAGIVVAGSCIVIGAVYTLINKRRRHR